jgi:hypothetical protein
MTTKKRTQKAPAKKRTKKSPGERWVVGLQSYNEAKKEFVFEGVEVQFTDVSGPPDKENLFRLRKKLVSEVTTETLVREFMAPERFKKVFQSKYGIKVHMLREQTFKKTDTHDMHWCSTAWLKALKGELLENTRVTLFHGDNNVWVHNTTGYAEWPFWGLTLNYLMNLEYDRGRKDTQEMLQRALGICKEEA